MQNSTNKVVVPKILKKSLKYSVVVKIVNFDPAKFSSRIIIVDGKPAMRIKGRVFTKI